MRDEPKHTGEERVGPKRNELTFRHRKRSMRTQFIELHSQMGTETKGNRLVWFANQKEHYCQKNKRREETKIGSGHRDAANNRKGRRTVSRRDGTTNHNKSWMQVYARMEGW